MGRFSEIDIELTYGPKPTTSPRIGSFGVCLNDPGNPPKFFELLQIVGGVGLFRPIDDPGAVVQFAIDEFWPLVDLTQ